MNVHSFPVVPTDPSTAAALKEMQGNILKGHGRDFSFNLFLQFTGAGPNLKQWIANFSNAFVTSADKQLAENKLFHDHRVPGGIFSALFLAKAGYDYLGLTAKAPTDPAFAGGMKHATALHDPAVSTWEPGFQPTLHALVLVADDELGSIHAFVEAIKQSLKGLATVTTAERGVVLRNALGDGIEHNGYVDGISQPAYFEADWRPLPTAVPLDWDDRTPADNVLVVDPGTPVLPAGTPLFGSYFVFRKLEQNVKGFKANEEVIAAAVLDPGADPELAGAMLVGRFEGGTPVLLNRHDTNPGPGHQENNFNYATDGDSSLKCPFHSHIRKTGPRTDGAGAAFNKTKRLTRRGIPFEDKPRVRDAAGNLSGNPADLPDKGVGLLFMCYGNSIQNQFEFVQTQWANAPGFSQPNTGIDPLIGQPHAGTVPYQWPTSWRSAAKKPASFASFINMRGGEYFFAPSLPTLRGMGTPPFALPEVLQPFVPVPGDIPPGG